MNRRYCWRVGGPVDVEDGDRCPECGSTPVGKFHHLLRSNQCGKWVQVPESLKGSIVRTISGCPCELDWNHNGECVIPETLLGKLGA